MLPAPRPSQIPESAPEREGLRESSSGGIVVVSNKHGTVPFSFSSSICRSKTDAEIGCSLVFTFHFTKVTLYISVQFLKTASKVSFLTIKRSYRKIKV